MSKYNKIYNPQSGRMVNLQGKLGRQILQYYINTLQMGGSDIFSRCIDGVCNLFSDSTVEEIDEPQPRTRKQWRDASAKAGRDVRPKELGGRIVQPNERTLKLKEQQLREAEEYGRKRHEAFRKRKLESDRAYRAKLQAMKRN